MAAGLFGSALPLLHQPLQLTPLLLIHFLHSAKLLSRVLAVRARDGIMSLHPYLTPCTLFLIIHLLHKNGVVDIHAGTGTNL